MLKYFEYLIIKNETFRTFQVVEIELTDKKIKKFETFRTIKVDCS